MGIGCDLTQSDTLVSATVGHFISLKVAYLFHYLILSILMFLLVEIRYASYILTNDVNPSLYLGSNSPHFSLLYVLYIVFNYIQEPVAAWRRLLQDTNASESASNRRLCDGFLM